MEASHSNSHLLQRQLRLEPAGITHYIDSHRARRHTAGGGQQRGQGDSCRIHGKNMQNIEEDVITTNPFMMAGFEAHDLTMTDVLECALNYSTGDSLRSLLGQFSGIAFVGGFSYADVLGSAKGWAATIRFNKRVRDAFESFRLHEGKFTLGVCNGCQLMALLGFIGREPASNRVASLPRNRPDGCCYCRRAQ